MQNGMNLLWAICAFQVSFVFRVLGIKKYYLPLGIYQWIKLVTADQEFYRTMWSWLRRKSLICFRMFTCLLSCRSQGRWVFWYFLFMCDMVRKWVWVGKKTNSAVAFKNSSNWEGCKVKQILPRIRKFCEFCGLVSFYYYFVGGLLLFLWGFALILLRGPKRKELWEKTVVGFSKKLEIGRKCEGKKWRLHWICKF